jgi:UDP-3-O-[3-hydroxymyristoyl] glucosamine N-acyltransferase
VITLGELAERFQLTLVGDPGLTVTGMATLASAGPQDLAFLSNKKYQSQLAETRAAAVILQPDLVEHCHVATLATDNPYLAFARITHVFAAGAEPVPGSHPSAVIHPDARVAASASIGPGAVIESGADVGEGVVLGAGAYVGVGSRIGAQSRLHPGARVYHDVFIGERCTLHSNCVIGADGFGFAPGPDGWEKICQLGGVRIGNDVEVGACTTIDRGALDHTIIADGVIIDNLVQVAHNCRIGKNTAIAGCTGLAGSTIIGENCTLAGGVGVVGHVEICDNVHVTGMTMVTRSITQPGSYSSGTPMMETRDWRKSAVRFSQLEKIQQRLAAVEKQADQ